MSETIQTIQKRGKCRPMNYSSWHSVGAGCPPPTGRQKIQQSLQMQLKVASHKCWIQNLKLSKKMIGGRTHNSKEPSSCQKICISSTDISAQNILDIRWCHILTMSNHLIVHLPRCCLDLCLMDTLFHADSPSAACLNLFNIPHVWLTHARIKSKCSAMHRAVASTGSRWHRLTCLSTPEHSGSWIIRLCLLHTIIPTEKNLT